MKKRGRKKSIWNKLKKIKISNKQLLLFILIALILATSTIIFSISRFYSSISSAPQIPSSGSIDPNPGGGSGGGDHFGVLSAWWDLLGHLVPLSQNWESQNHGTLLSLQWGEDDHSFSSTIGSEVHLPFGGVKGTGNGTREAGIEGIHEFSETKTVYIDYSGKLQKAQIDTGD